MKCTNQSGPVRLKEAVVSWVRKPTQVGTPPDTSRGRGKSFRRGLQRQPCALHTTQQWHPSSIAAQASSMKFLVLELLTSTSLQLTVFPSLGPLSESHVPASSPFHTSRNKTQAGCAGLRHGQSM